MAETASDLFVDRLTDWGVDTVFGLPGDGINGFMEALRKRQGDLRYVHVRHEEVGAMAAVGYARLTGKLGVCFATSGPGASHLANGLLDARLEGVPLLAVTGMTYHDLIGTHYLQDFDTDYLFSNLAAYNQRIMGPEHIHNVLDFACRTALANRMPVHIAFPIDYQAADAEDLMRYKRDVPGHTTSAFTSPVRTPPEEELRHAAELLRGRTRPAILAGRGARGARAELEPLAEVLGAPIAKASLGKDCVPDDHPYVTGGIGVLGTRPTQDAIERCDAFILVGSSMPYIEFLPPPGQAVCVQIDDKPERIGLRHPVDVGLVGDARATLRALLPRLERNEDRAFLEQAQAGIREWWRLMEERGTRTETPMKPQVVAWHLAQALDDDAIVCGDSGQVTYWVTQMMLRRDQRFIYSGTNCSMAAALPYAIGAQTAYADRQVIAFTGDGSLTMQLGDLATLMQHDLPVKVICFKNDTLGLIKWEQMAFLGNPEYGVDFAPVDFVKVGEGLGATAFRIDDPATCGEQLREELRRGEESRVRIGLTIGRSMLHEAAETASPYGVLARVKDKVGGR
jgi:pyruvate dehydrogenase (quinone)/pyruvate oxidase